MNIQFNEERHEYKVDGLIIPSVTQVLSAVGLPDLSGVPADLLEWKCGLGTAVHRATELDDLNDLDEDALDERIKPYLEAYRRFKLESGFSALGFEQTVYDDTYKFAGTYDRIGTMNGKTVLIDFKTGMIDPKVVGPQTAAYTMAGGFKSYKRFALKLNGDSSYKLVELKNPMDWQIFLNALNIYKWKNGGK